MKSRVVSGFTLVEVMIVVVILAVLAAVVIPQFSSSTDDAKRSTGEYNLSALRSIVQNYKAQHGGANPVHDAATKSLPGLLSKTDKTGAISATGTFGPYLLEMPANPFTGNSIVTLITVDPPTSTNVTPSNAGGWLYNATAGKIWLDSAVGFDF